MSFNKKKYEIQLDLYIKKINENNQSQSELEERETRKKYYNGYDYEKIIKMSEEEFYEYISKLWTMIIWGNKEYIINKYINYNGFDNLKKSIADLLYGNDDLTKRWDKFNKNIKGFGPAMMSELLCYIHPYECMIWNSTSLLAFQYLEISDLLVYNYQKSGEKYNELCNYCKELLKIADEKTGIKNDFLFIDYLFWDNLKLYKSSIKKSSDSIITVTTIENKKSLHTELKEKLEILIFSWDLMLLMK